MAYFHSSLAARAMLPQALHMDQLSLAELNVVANVFKQKRDKKSGAVAITAEEFPELVKEATLKAGVIKGTHRDRFWMTFNWDEMFKRIDTDGNNRITEEEFIINYKYVRDEFYRYDRVFKRRPFFWENTKRKYKSMVEDLAEAENMAANLVKAAVNDEGIKLSRYSPNAWKAWHIYHSLVWEHVRWLAITLHCVLAVFEAPRTYVVSDAPSYFYMLLGIEAGCCAIYVADIAIKWYALGLNGLFGMGAPKFEKAARREERMRNVNVNRAILFLVTCLVVDLVIAFAVGPGWFRFSRICRPILFGCYDSNLRHLSDLIFKSLKYVVPIATLIFLLIVIFAAMGVQLFAHGNAEETYVQTPLCLPWNETGGDGGGGGSGSGTNSSSLSFYNSTMDEGSGCTKNASLDDNFDNFLNASLSLFVLLTTENYPGVMYPALEITGWYSLYFIAFLLFGVFILMQVLTATVFEAYSINARESILLRKRRELKGFLAAFQVLALADAYVRLEYPGAYEDFDRNSQSSNSLVSSGSSSALGAGGAVAYRRMFGPPEESYAALAMMKSRRQSVFGGANALADIENDLEYSPLQSEDTASPVSELESGEGSEEEQHEVCVGVNSHCPADAVAVRVEYSSEGEGVGVGVGVGVSGPLGGRTRYAPAGAGLRRRGARALHASTASDVRAGVSGRGSGRDRVPATVRSYNRTTGDNRDGSDSESESGDAASGVGGAVESERVRGSRFKEAPLDELDVIAEFGVDDLFCIGDVGGDADSVGDGASTHNSSISTNTSSGNTATRTRSKLSADAAVTNWDNSVTSDWGSGLELRFTQHQCAGGDAKHASLHAGRHAGGFVLDGGESGTEQQATEYDDDLEDSQFSSWSDSDKSAFTELSYFSGDEDSDVVWVEENCCCCLSRKHAHTKQHRLVIRPSETLRVGIVANLVQRMIELGLLDWGSRREVFRAWEMRMADSGPKSRRISREILTDKRGFTLEHFLIFLDVVRDFARTRSTVTRYMCLVNRSGQRAATYKQQLAHSATSTEEYSVTNAMDLGATARYGDASSDDSGIHCCNNPRAELINFLESTPFNLAIFFLILVNTIALCLFYKGISDDYVRVLDIIDQVTLAIFVVELVVKVSGFGVRRYFHDWWNKVDFIVVVTAVVAWIQLQVALELYRSSNGVSRYPWFAVRLVRVISLLRVFKLIPYFETFKPLVLTLASIQVLVMRLMIVVTIFIYFYAIIGVELFAGTFAAVVGNEDDDYPQFDNFLYAMLSLFQVYTTSNWHEIMYMAMKARGWWVSLYFVTFFCLMCIVIANVAVAIVWEVFSVERTSASNIINRARRMRALKTINKRWHRSIKKTMAKEGVDRPRTWEEKMLDGPDMERRYETISRQVKRELGVGLGEGAQYSTMHTAPEVVANSLRQTASRLTRLGHVMTRQQTAAAAPAGVLSPAPGKRTAVAEVAALDTMLIDKLDDIMKLNSKLKRAVEDLDVNLAQRKQLQKVFKKVPTATAAALAGRLTNNTTGTVSMDPQSSYADTIESDRAEEEDDDEDIVSEYGEGYSNAYSE